MLRKILFYTILILLGIALWINPNFKIIVAGVAILLFGMIMLEDGFKVFTTGRLQNILKKATDKLYKGIMTGAIVTGLIQSSSLVSVITISFISAGLITLAGGIGLIFGANIGTTATAWLVAGFGLKIKISALAMPMLVFGILLIFQKKESYKGIGNILAGLGFFFLGIHYMKEGFEVYKESVNLASFAIEGFWGYVVFTGIGILMTTILQSSSATMALILTALAVGQIEYENALALAIGANVGTTITAVLGSLSANIAGKRLAGAHFIFNLVTGAVALAFIIPISKFVKVLSDILSIASDNYTLRLAIFHTIFNILGVLIMIPFVSKLEKFLLRVFKEKEFKDINEPKYLNESVLDFPETAIDSIYKETKYLFKRPLFKIVSHGLNIQRTDIKSDIKLKKIVKNSHDPIDIDVDEFYYSKVKYIYSEILKYTAITQKSSGLSDKHVELLVNVKEANRKIVEIIRYTGELNKNIEQYLNSNNEYMVKIYDNFRKEVSVVLREIYLMRKDEDYKKHFNKLKKMNKKRSDWKEDYNKKIDKLIRNDQISPLMASSLFNDSDNVNDIIKLLIETAELLYTKAVDLNKIFNKKK